MIYKSNSAAMACAVLALTASAFSLRAELKPEDLYDAISPSVVTLDVESTSGKHFVGNAFVAVGDGLAVTAWHVVHDARRVEARFANGARVGVAGLIDKNEKLDVALLKLGGTHPAQIKLASTDPRVGSRVYLLGSPRGLDFSISEGLIGQVRTIDGVRYYQISGPISPGDSGGPVLNENGEAIGVVSWRKVDAENVGFAVPSQAVASMNPLLPLLEWSRASGGQSPSSTVLAATPRVRAPIGASAPPQGTDTFSGFQEFLAGHGGERVTIVVQQQGKETRFSFEVPKQAAK